MARKFGITTVGILPGSANPIGGMGAAIKTYGKTVEEMLINYRDENGIWRKSNECIRNQPETKSTN